MSHALARRALVPLVLTGLRAALAPVMLWLAWFDPLPWAFGVCLTAAFISDVFDGIIARRLRIATPALRRFDSVADTVFYIATLAAAWHVYPAGLHRVWPALTLLAALELTRYAFDLVKFRREAAYHLWSSKLWGIALFVGFMGLLVGGRGGWCVTVPLACGMVADLEGLAVSLMLRTWQNDVPSLVHARSIRHSPNGSASAPTGRSLSAQQLPPGPD